MKMRIKVMIIVVIFVLLVSVFGTGLYFLLREAPSPEYKIAYLGAPGYSPFWAKLNSAINIEGEKRGFLVDDYTPFADETETRLIMSERILKENYDAVIFGLNPNLNFSTKFIENLIYYNIPIFAIDRVTEFEKMTGFVRIDDYESGRIAGQYILDNIDSDGKVLIVIPNLVHENAVRRGESAKSLLIDNNIYVKSVNGNTLTWDGEETGRVVRKELEKEKDYDAVFVVWDDAVLIVRDIMEELGVNKNVIYIGFNGLDFALEEVKNNGITGTIMSPSDNLANAVFDQIDNYLNGEEFEKEVLVPGFLVTKDNVDEYIVIEEN